MKAAPAGLDSYRQAWEYLDSLQFFKIKLGLDSMARFLGRLGNPQEQLRFVHVAGTNGKGSTAAVLQAILSRAGYRVGLYTSPHLSCVRERFRINEAYIDQEAFTRHAAAIYGVLAGEQITYFEFTTALALLWFAEQRVELAILEVGMGGRLDATNVITPRVGVITNVSLDHQAYLGDTLAAVAWEKAGIIKPGVPLVSGVAADEAGQVVTARCRELAAPLYQLGRDFSWQANQTAPPAGDHLSWDYRGMAAAFSALPSTLRGRHQLANQSLALAVLELLAPELPVPESALRAGLAGIGWPGRLELLQTGEAGHERRILLDGAHNPAGVAELVAALQRDFSYRRLVVIWGAMADKDLAAGLELMAPLAPTFIFTRPEAERSATVEELWALLPPESRPRALAAAGVVEALELACRQSGGEDLVVVAGSLYLVGAARCHLLGELVPDQPDKL